MQPHTPASPRIALTTDVDLASLGARWRELESRADGSFFTSWTWIGCLAAERFDAPVLLQATRDALTVGLALFNRKRGAAWLHETGLPALDAIFIEHNGVLIATGETDALPAGLGAVRRMAGRVVLSGVAPETRAAAAAAGSVIARAERAAPYVDLARLRGEGRAYLDAISANTRYQLRRSEKRYGGAVLHRAQTVAQAHEWLDALALLHQATWSERGKPGAFANPDFLRFHRALITEGLPRGEIDLLRADAADGATIGYLYNLRWRGRVMSYQSGFDYAGATHPHQKPGLTCHHLAIERALSDGAEIYDFLAGDSRYKTSLATHQTVLHWLEMSSRWSPRASLALIRSFLKKRTKKLLLF